MGLEIAFWVLAIVGIGAALAVVLLRDIFRAALCLVLCFLTVAGIYITLSADFLAAVQVLIYVGAISVLIILAIMLTRGTVLRASGVKWDIRKADPYSIYDRFEFEIPTGEVGDCYDRYRVRIEEMRQSLRIIEQAMEQIPSGAVKSEVPHLIRPPVGEAYAHIETPKGELGFYLVSDNSIAPYRCHIRAPSLINLTALREMVIGWKIQDAIIIFGSIDITVGEVDR